nr:immunoglobulin heavy chain junction region [Macaca mulatta]MOW19764.1 immunoglobulin heavy chain junction region [Macaca mulatta]MOW19774.1 immunoglobulin heavy chain junction region [Macaca mulatta]MOW19957.1 immunoglobulin heavy chain junction region [Macaca mulatta]MOW20054.1 immunoglobulin heavy chain junction region [Macaca mulatta]
CANSGTFYSGFDYW